MLLGVADGVSQIEDYGINPALLPQELLEECSKLALQQLYPEQMFGSQVDYHGPIPLLRRAFEQTEEMGSTTALIAVLDNSTKIHGRLQPMIAVLSIGDCELVVMRRKSRSEKLNMVFHTEMQRIDGHAQTPLQVARLDERVCDNFDERMTIDVIEKGSAVHCMCIFEGDILLLGSDGVFDNLFLPELVTICNELMPPTGATEETFSPTPPAVLEKVAKRIVADCHKKANLRPDGSRADAPIGKGGKPDDTCIVVSQVVEWTTTRIRKWENEQDLVEMPASSPQAICQWLCSPETRQPEGSDSDRDSDSDEVSEVVNPLTQVCNFGPGPRSPGWNRR
jgi:protein phosphatase PTC7